MSKLQRHCDRLENTWMRWTKSLDAATTTDLRDQLEYVEGLLARTPARHQRVLADRQARVNVLRAKIASREVR